LLVCPLRGLFHDLGSHIATEVYFDHDVVGVKIIVAFHRRFAPLCRTAGSRAVGQHREPSIIQQSGCDYANFVGAT
jgi:hypothetical protein